MAKQISLTESGLFTVGCNYWASHAGMMMWSDWQENVVKEDFKQLAENGLEAIRVFPLWPDFQPLKRIYTCGGAHNGLRLGDAPLPGEGAGKYGVSQDAIDHFRIMADAAEENGLKLVVGLITGWMSGRLFVPPAFEGLDVIMNPEVRMWQIRFVRYFVSQLKNHPAILAWDLGNECNCMGKPATPYDAWNWTAGISSAIRLEDPDRPIVSGMHSLSPAKSATWRIQDQGELTDVLTTHPYPIFTAHCNQDPVNTMRNGLHATAESRLYADISGKTCFAEELGTLGPMVCSESVAADYLRSALFSLWANDCQAMLWWCAYDQDFLDFAPYDTNTYERELGLIRKDRKTKPVLKTIKDFIETYHKLNIRLPKRTIDAVCILTDDQDSWGAAYSSFIIAKQAGIELEFQYCDQPLRDASIYMLPSINGGKQMTKYLWEQLIRKAEEGATVYVSNSGGFLSPFNKPIGLDVVTREGGANIKFELDVDGEMVSYSIDQLFKLKLEATTATVLASEADGNPVFSVNHVGKGKIYFLAVPLEMHATYRKGIFLNENEQTLHHIYQIVAKDAIAAHVIQKASPFVGLTEHLINDHEAYAVLVNYTPETIEDELTLKDGWQITECLHGKPVDGSSYSISKNNGMILKLAKTN